MKNKNINLLTELHDYLCTIICRKRELQIAVVIIIIIYTIKWNRVSEKIRRKIENDWKKANYDVGRDWSVEGQASRVSAAYIQLFPRYCVLYAR